MHYLLVANHIKQQYHFLNLQDAWGCADEKVTSDHSMSFLFPDQHISPVCTLPKVRRKRLGLCNCQTLDVHYQLFKIKVPDFMNINTMDSMRQCIIFSCLHHVIKKFASTLGSQNNF